MIKFSESKQAFYETSLNYSNLPDDLIEISAEQHNEMLQLINAGHHIFSDLTYSEKRPSYTYVWQDGGWIDTQTSQQRYEKYLKSLKPLTRRQLKLVLLDNGLLDNIDTVIASIEDVEARRYIQIEYNESTHFERFSPSVAYMCQLLELTDEQVNQMWEVGLTL